MELRRKQKISLGFVRPPLFRTRLLLPETITEVTVSRDSRSSLALEVPFDRFVTPSNEEFSSEWGIVQPIVEHKRFGQTCSPSSPIFFFKFYGKVIVIYISAPKLLHFGELLEPSPGSDHTVDTA